MRIDVGAYFRRIGYDGPRAPTLAVLRDLHRLHPQAIAFENLDPLLRRLVKLDLPSLQSKFVEGGRGGYCFEHNTLLADVLRQLGFTVREATARVRWTLAPDVRTPRVHCLLLVGAEGETYLVDVGFGGNVLTAPLLLSSRAAQVTPHEEFRLVSEGDSIVQEMRRNDVWEPLYAFDFSETVPADFEMGNWFTSAHPGSIFVNGLLMARCEPDRRYGLRDNALVVHKRAGGSERTTLRSARELRDALTDIFKLRLDGLDGLDAALARLCVGTA